jgi:K+-sensing histidine kinase KdpD
VSGETTDERVGFVDERLAGEPAGTRLWVVRYGAALAAGVVALAIQSLLVPLFGVSPNATPLMAFFVAVMVAAAWFGGLGPGLAATCLSVLFSWFFFLSPQYSLELGTLGQSLRLVVFVVEGVIISWLAGTMYSTRREAEARALEIGRSERELGARARQQEAVAELGQRAVGNADLRTLMEEAVASVAEVLEVEYAKVLELLPGDEELLLR